MVKSSYFPMIFRWVETHGFPMGFPMGFQPFPPRQTKWLDLHDLSVGPAILAIRWWLAEAGAVKLHGAFPPSST